MKTISFSLIIIPKLQVSQRSRYSSEHPRLSAVPPRMSRKHVFINKRVSKQHTRIKKPRRNVSATEEDIALVQE